MKLVSHPHGAMEDDGGGAPTKAVTDGQAMLLTVHCSEP